MIETEAIIFFIKLPYHIFHMLTFGKYQKLEKFKTIYKSSGIIFFIFNILGIIIYLLYKLSLIFKQ